MTQIRTATRRFGLSKSKITAFEQCPKKLWLATHQGEGFAALPPIFCAATVNMLDIFHDCFPFCKSSAGRWPGHRPCLRAEQPGVWGAARICRGGAGAGSAATEPRPGRLLLLGSGGGAPCFPLTQMTAGIPARPSGRSSLSATRRQSIRTREPEAVTSRARQGS